jgi:hypothetical protein
MAIKIEDMPGFLISAQYFIRRHPFLVPDIHCQNEGRGWGLGQ